MADHSPGAAGGAGREAPGTPAFRRALRDAIERTCDMVGSQGVFNMSATDHSGSDQRAIVLAGIHDGMWQLVK